MAFADDLAPAAAPRVHGGPARDELEALGIDPADLVDFSVNVNPYGPHPAVVAAARAAPLDRYPDPTAGRVREAIAARVGRAPAEVVFGNGAADLLWTFARAFLPRRRLLLVEPAFSELRAAAECAGAEVHAWRGRIEDRYDVDADAVADAALAARADVVALCTPTTPLGRAVPAAATARLAARVEGAAVLLDESFLSLADGHADEAAPLPPNVLRLRSMTKAHAVPGVRAGYLLAPARIAAALEAARPAWATSSVAQAAALAALDEVAFVAGSRHRLRADREALAAGLAALGVAPIPSTAPYLAFPAGDAAALRRRLLARGALVRDCASFGLPDLVRVAARPAPDRARLLAALAEEI